MFAPFSDWTREINNTQIENAKEIDVAISMDSLIEYSDYSSKTSKVCGNILEMNQLMLMIVLLIFLVTVLCSNLNKK